MTKLRFLPALFALSFGPVSALAQEFPFQGFVTVPYAGVPNPGNVSYCGGPTGPNTFVVEGTAPVSLRWLLIVHFPQGSVRGRSHAGMCHPHRS